MVWQQKHFVKLFVMVNKKQALTALRVFCIKTLSILIRSFVFVAHALVLNVGIVGKSESAKSSNKHVIPRKVGCIVLWIHLEALFTF